MPPSRLALLAVVSLLACRDADGSHEARLRSAPVAPSPNAPKVIDDPGPHPADDRVNPAQLADEKTDEKTDEKRDVKKGDRQDNDWVPKEFTNGLARWKDTGVYIDGKPIGFLTWGELPLGCKPSWLRDKVSADKRYGTNDPGWKWARKRYYKFTDYLKAVGVDLRKVKELHVYDAEVHNSQVTVAVPAPKNDMAPTNTVQTPDGPVQRLRRTDQEQAGNEMTAFSLYSNGKDGLYFSMTTELNGVRAQNNMQLSVTRFSLTQDTATGAVSAIADTASARFATANNGNERRNANAPTAMTINGGNVVCAKYNYQPNGTNDTVRYVQCFDVAGKTILPQTKAFAKNNDDCAMHQDGEPGAVVSFDKGTATTKLIDWAGCNGNGTDDGWLFVSSIKCDSADAPTSCKFSNTFDVSLAAREERSRGACTVSAADPSFAVCSWTEGNNQPQRDGVWLAGVDLASNAKGSNQQQTILWKKQIAGRIDNANGIRTYAQRAVQERIMAMNPTTNTLEPSDTIIYRYGDASGNNNTNQGKGGTYRSQMLSVIKTARTGMTYVAQPVDMQTKLLGLGGTHLGAAAAMFGTTDHLMPGLVFLNGSHTGGGPGAQIRSVGLDTATNQFSDLGMQQVASQDRHLYSNYLGNNPGNQGRNHSQMTMVKNPFVGQAGNTDAYVLVTATSGKAMADVGNAAIKLTAFLSVTGIAQTPAVATGTTPAPGTGTATTANAGDSSSDPGTTLGGCSTGGSSGLATSLLIGLAAVIRRRR